MSAEEQQKAPQQKIRVLIGMLCDGHAGGVDKFILNFYQTADPEKFHFDFLTNLPENPLREEMRARGSEIFTVCGLTHPLRQYRETRRLLSAHHYDVVYMNISTALTFPIVKAAKDSGVAKVVVHSHSSAYDCENAVRRSIMTLLHRLFKGVLCRNANTYLTCSDKAAAWMFTPRVCASGKVQRIQNAVRTDNFHFDEQKRAIIRERYHVTDKFVIGHVGNHLYQKNIFFLIDAFRLVAEKDPDAVLFMIGDGNLHDAAVARVHAYGLEDRVMIPGRADMAEGYMSAFDIFVLPSRFEGMPIVSIEAQCTMLPCIFSGTITREASISNMCTFVPIKKPADWAAAMENAKQLDRREMRLSTSLEAFSLENSTRVLSDILSDVENEE